MIALIRSEWIKLRTVRSNVTTAILAVAIPLLITLLSVAFMKTSSIDESTLSDFVLGTGSIAVLLIGVIGVLCVTQEYSQGTIRLTLAATPGRTRVYVGKATLMALVGAALTGFIILASLVVGSLILGSRDVPGSHTSMSAGLTSMVLMGALVALLGMAIGTLTRNPPSAITTLVLWPLLVEGIVGGLLSLAVGDDVRRWMPFQTGFNSMFPESPDDGFTRWESLGYFAAWVLVVTVLAERGFKRRDA